MNVIVARLKRWWYLFSQGVCRGECPFEIYDDQGLRILGSGSPKEIDVWGNYKIWWERPE